MAGGRKEIHGLVERMKTLVERCGGFSFMEVCGTHTVAIFQSGLRSLFPEGLRHISGPGCPVCVTHARDISLGMELVRGEGIVLATFGDMMRVPDAQGMSLKMLRAKGARVHVCYSPLDALDLAQREPGVEVVFWGIGFETTSPTVAATIKEAQQRGVSNFSVLPAHKLIPPALDFLLSSGVEVDGLLLPGHVSTVIGVDVYGFIPHKYGVPAVISGFEPLDIAMSICRLMEMKLSGRVEVFNQYTRAVKRNGNPRARALLEEVFERDDALWRGIGIIKGSGLRIRDSYSAMDALKRFNPKGSDISDPPGCRCGEVLQGKITPPMCPLFKKRCTPMSPVGPCMVSTEGSCAAYYKYGTC